MKLLLLLSLLTCCVACTDENIIHYSGDGSLYLGRKAPKLELQVDVSKLPKHPVVRTRHLPSGLEVREAVKAEK